jgi:hypothetical protein
MTMEGSFTPGPAPIRPPATGVLDAWGQGWDAVTSDFWSVWALGLLFGVIQLVIGLFGIIPCLGGVISLVTAVFVTPPLLAGLYFAVNRRLDGGSVEIGDLFAGFRERFGASVVAQLLQTIGTIVLVGLFLLYFFGAAALTEAIRREEFRDAAALFTILPAALLLVLVLFVFNLLFTFIQVAVWDCPQSGWSAVMASIRIVAEHPLGMVGFSLIGIVIWVLAFAIGTLLLCVGNLLTVPAAFIWWTASVAAVYRAWRPLPPPT